MTRTQIYKAALCQGWDDYFTLLETGNEEAIARQGKLNRLLCSKAIQPFTSDVKESTTQIREQSHSGDAITQW